MKGVGMGRGGLAILACLAETTGKFAPADDQRTEALRWMLFDNHKFTGSYAPHRFLGTMTAEPSHPALLSYFAARVENAFGIVDKHLGDRPFMLGERPTIVDFSLLGTPLRRIHSCLMCVVYTLSVLPSYFPVENPAQVCGA